jgi:hypothetical protein
VAGCHSFLFILIFYNIHTFIQSQYIHPSPFAEASFHILIACVLSGENFPVGPSLESNSGLPYSKPTRCQLSHAAPYEPLRRLLERKQKEKICVHNIPEGGDRSGASKAGVSRLSTD